MAKNQIKRSLLQVIDTPPTKAQKQQIWHYFNNECAYCGIAIDPDGRQGHLDHLLSVQDGGSNEIYNFVLACNICNGDEKREMPWRIFLKSKCKDLSKTICAERLTRIEKWQQQSIISQLDTDFIDKINVIIEQAKINFDESVQQMRELRDAIIKN